MVPTNKITIDKSRLVITLGACIVGCINGKWEMENTCMMEWKNSLNMYNCGWCEGIEIDASIYYLLGQQSVGIKCEHYIAILQLCPSTNPHAFHIYFWKNRTFHLQI